MALLLCFGNHLRLLGLPQLVPPRIILGDPLEVLSPWHLFKQPSCHQRSTSAPAIDFVFQSLNVQSMEILWVPMNYRWTPKLAHGVCALRVFLVFVTEQGSKRMQPELMILSGLAQQMPKASPHSGSGPVPQGGSLCRLPWVIPARWPQTKEETTQPLVPSCWGMDCLLHFKTKTWLSQMLLTSWGSTFQRWTQFWECCWNSLWGLRE